jgi:hypothetical protein|tara:strand:+ start:38632 stop:38838 length:207 start_codon:yes stop_codon:yes gene_type:complete
MNIGALYKTGYGYGRAEGESEDDPFEVLDRGLIDSEGSWWRSDHWDSVAPSYSKKSYEKFVLPEEYLL